MQLTVFFSVWRTLTAAQPKSQISSPILLLSENTKYNAKYIHSYDAIPSWKTLRKCKPVATFTLRILCTICVDQYKITIFVAYVMFGTINNHSFDLLSLFKIHYKAHSGNFIRSHTIITIIYIINTKYIAWNN